MIDFHHIATRHDEIDRRLRDWARWVRVRPWREAQEAMFAMIDRQPGRPTKDAVIAQIRAMDQGGVA